MKGQQVSETNNIHNKAPRNYTVDLFKFFASLLIIGIHTSPFSDVNENVYFFVVHVFCRLAVPFFAVCSGFFLAKTNVADSGLKTLKKQETKLIKIYLIWTFLYFLYDIPFAVKGGYFTIKNYIGFGLSVFTKGSHFHLWYLISIIYALPVFFLCVRFLSRKAIVILMVLLYSVEAVSYGYSMWLPSSVLNIFNQIKKPSALFLILPLLLLGYLIATRELPKLSFCVIGLFVSFVLLTFEAFILKSHGQEKFSYIFFTLPTAYFVFSTVIQLKFAQGLRLAKILGEVSTFIYCFHPMIVEVLPEGLPSLQKYSIVAFVSVLVSVGYYYIKKTVLKRKHL